eukprot:snap_masked-scaffold_3-processed-gene-0.37-mRNA-1 protein AED:1.00 eAED:1.00 QI:0/-1/0/0/-1/1/1/0/74
MSEDFPHIVMNSCETIPGREVMQLVNLLSSVYPESEYLAVQGRIHGLYAMKDTEQSSFCEKLTYRKVFIDEKVN